VVEGARGGCGAELVGCGWAGTGSVVLWCERWVVAVLCVGEERSLGVASLAVNLVPAKPADKTEQKPTRTRISRKWTKSRKPTRTRNSHKCRESRYSQNKEQQTKMHKTRITQRSRQKQKSQENKKREQNCASKSKSRTKPKQKSCEEARVIRERWGV